MEIILSQEVQVHLLTTLLILVPLTLQIKP